MTEGSICDEMRAGSADVWDGLHAHPFLRELADGSLPLEAFRFFLEQDNLYLVEYARCLAMGAAKSRDDTQLRYFTVDLAQVLESELPSNTDLLARVIEMGAADRAGALGMAPANVAYTSYLQALAMRGYITDYVAQPLDEKGLAALKPGKNVIAVHCKQTGGGQYIDVGLVQFEQRR